MAMDSGEELDHENRRNSGPNDEDLSWLEEEDLSWVQHVDGDEDMEGEDDASPILPGLSEGPPADDFPFETAYEVEDMGNLSDDDVNSQTLEAAGFIAGQDAREFEITLLQGRTFKSWGEFWNVVEDYEALSGWVLTRKMRRSYGGRVVCRDRGKDGAGCQVNISARILKKTGKITITKAYLRHTCQPGIHKFRNGSNRTSWLSRKVLKHVKINSNIPMKELDENLRQFHDTSSTAWSLYRARSACREQLTGSSKEIFQKIPTYMKAIIDVDPGAIALYQTGPEQRFVRMFISTTSARVVFRYCRPLVGLDSTHTHGNFPMTLLLATCFDGENHIVILAWALVPVENTDHWTWFMEHMRRAFKELDGDSMVFISDQDKGLQGAVVDVFPNAYHAHCVQHLRANVKGAVDAHCSKYFLKIAEAITIAEFERLISKFEPMNDRQQKFIPYVRKMNEFAYARHAFPGRRWGHNTSNVVEIINQAVKPGRGFPPLQLSDFLWTYCMEHHYKRQQHAKELPGGEYALTEYANNLLNRLYTESRSVKERKSSENESLMIDAKGSWTVRMEERHCDCGDWKEMDFPCSHAIRFLSERNMDPREWVGKVWLASNQQLAYSVPIPSLPITRLQCSAETCKEPVVNKKDKKKKDSKRRPGYFEQMARNNKRLVQKQSHKCRRCGREGHNQRTCLDEPPQSATAPPIRPSTTAAASSRPTPADVLVVGDSHSTARLSTNQPWEVFHTRAHMHLYAAQEQSYTEWCGSQPGPSQPSL